MVLKSVNGLYITMSVHWCITCCPLGISWKQL